MIVEENFWKTWGGGGRGVYDIMAKYLQKHALFMTGWSHLCLQLLVWQFKNKVIHHFHKINVTTSG